MKFLSLVFLGIMSSNFTWANICINDPLGDAYPNPIITCAVVRNYQSISKCFMGKLRINNLKKSRSGVEIDNCELKQFTTKIKLINQQKLEITYQDGGVVIERNFTPDSDGFFRAIIKLEGEKKRKIACVTQCASDDFFPVEF